VGAGANNLINREGIWRKRDIGKRCASEGGRQEGGARREEARKRGGTAGGSRASGRGAQARGDGRREARVPLRMRGLVWHLAASCRTETWVLSDDEENGGEESSVWAWRRANGEASETKSSVAI
jgi:hypothetical protein